MSNQSAPTPLAADYSYLENIISTNDPDHQTFALSKDVPINQSNNTWVRIFLLRQTLDSSSSTKLPLIVYFHGGGFTALSPATMVFHDFSSEIAAQLPCLVVSVEYRLAPIHRLPAAYDDAMEVLDWIKTTQEDWLQKYADFSSCFLMGDSAGGNIAYHAALRAASEANNLPPLKIRGLILYKPFFGGVKRTESELRWGNDPGLPISTSDLLWESSLPLGADRDHEYCNPTVGGGSELLEQIRLLGWKVMLNGGYEDPLSDRQIELVKVMKEKGMKVESHFDETGHRLQDFMDSAVRQSLYDYIKNFVLYSV